jgi:hypothetical protein
MRSIRPRHPRLAMSRLRSILSLRRRRPSQDARRAHAARVPLLREARTRRRLLPAAVAAQRRRCPMETRPEHQAIPGSVHRAADVLRRRRRSSPSPRSSSRLPSSARPSCAGPARACLHRQRLPSPSRCPSRCPSPSPCPRRPSPSPRSCRCPRPRPSPSPRSCRCPRPRPSPSPRRPSPSPRSCRCPRPRQRLAPDRNGLLQQQRLRCLVRRPPFPRFPHSLLRPPHHGSPSSPLPQTRVEHAT